MVARHGRHNHCRQGCAGAAGPHRDRKRVDQQRITRQFTLTLPSDCAFTTLTGATSVTVYQQSKTMMSGTSPIASGTAMHAFGLLFYDGGQWKMVASRIGAN